MSIIVLIFSGLENKKHDPVQIAVGFVCISIAYATISPPHNHEYISDR